MNSSHRQTKVRISSWLIIEVEKDDSVCILLSSEIPETNNKYAMKKKHKAYRHITAENISISILQNHTIPKHSFVDHPLQSISKQCLGTGNIPVNKSESVDFYWE